MSNLSNKIDLNNLIIDTASSAIKIQNDDGSFPSGHNGPWNQEDTPVRVTSHWGILLLEAFHLSGESIFKTSAEKAYSFLLSKKNRPYNYSFHCIKSDKETIQVNGLIGQAWAIESLIKAYENFNNSKYLNIAEDLILKHKFNENLSLWHILGLNGNILRVHTTFNQQLWFSIMGHKIAILAKNSEILNKTNKFFKKLTSYIKFDKYLEMHINDFSFKPKLKRIKMVAAKIVKKGYLNEMSKGYLSFSLLGFAKLYDIDKELDLWNDVKLKNIILKSIQFLDEIIYHEDTNKFGFQYNPIGFEAAIIKEKFSNYLVDYTGRKIEDWIQKQLNNHYNFEEKLMLNNTVDRNTLASRFYEITKLQNRNFNTI